MSTAAPPRPDTARTPLPDTDGGVEPGRFAQWLATWTVALRMARRDVRRHRGRSALVVVMVLLPTLLLSTVVTLAYTSQVTGAEQVPATMGSGQALLEGPEPTRVVQAPDPTGSGYLSDDDQDARTVPGLDREGDAFANAGAVGRLVGAPVAPVDHFGARTTIGDRRLSLQGLALDGRLGLGARLSLTSGRWPSPPSADPAEPVEVLVTPHAVSRGVPDAGALSVRTDAGDRTLEVVGVAEVADRWSPTDLVAAGEVGGTGTPGYGRWIVLGGDPVTWSEVRRLDEYGFRVTSRAVLEDPPPDAQVDPLVFEATRGDTQRTALMVGLAAAMLLVSTTLLVGPAFAVSAARQRRTLALAASNGAHTPALRRTVLAQALVLGAATAVAGVLLGVAVALGIVTWVRSSGDPTLDGPFDVRPLTLAGIVAAATLSTVVAALVPARRLGRLDIVGVMRGQSVSPRPSVLVLAVGILLAVVGGALTLGGTGVIGGQALTILGQSREYLVVAGAVVLILGSLLLVPMTLAGLGRLGGRLPTALRMSARDLARHRARSAPSVAAVLAVVSGLTFGLTGLASDTEQQRREYVPSTLPGEVLVMGPEQDLTYTDAVRAAAPDLVVTPNTVFVGDPAQYSADILTQPYRAGFVSVVPAGCTPEQTLLWFADGPDALHCGVAGTQSNGSGQVLVLPADELVRRLGLSDADAARVRAGAAVALGLTGDTVRVARGDYRMDPTAQERVDPDVRVEQDVTVPLVPVARTKEDLGRMLGATLAFAADTPTTRDWPVRPTSWTVRTDDGSEVPDATVETMQQSLGDDAYVQREDGFQRDDRLVVAILLAVFGVLILVVTLTSTALTLAEQQTDQATLAALGATRGTRRVMAAAQAFLLTAVGCVLGVAVGIVPGIAIARPLTSTAWDPVTYQSVEGPSVLVLPWLPLLVVGVLVPLVAAGLAAAGIRRAPQVTRRAT